MKRVVVICPECGSHITYKNYWSWVWYTPFHWFGKRRIKCFICGKVSWVRRNKDI